MIHSQRLEKYIHNREWQKSNNLLVEVIGQMTPEQRQEIREMLQNNRKQNNNLVK